MGGYWQRETAQRSGRSTEYTRQGDTGNKVTCHFCPTCGSTVFWFPELVPDKVGVAVGCFGDPLFPPPRAVSYTPHKHAWIEFPEGIPHNEKSSVGKS